MSSREVRRFNQTVLNSLEPGDMLQFDRGVYSHWGVYVGNDEVVHVSGVDGQMGSNVSHSCSISGVQFDKGVARKDDFWTVVGDSRAFKNNSKDNSLKHFRPSEIVNRALSRHGQVGYNVFYKNCEHFATWCRYDKEQSDQVNWLIAILTAVVAYVIAIFRTLFNVRR